MRFTPWLARLPPTRTCQYPSLYKDISFSWVLRRGLLRKDGRPRQGPDVGCSAVWVGAGQNHPWCLAKSTRTECCTWMNEEEFCRAFVGHSVSSSFSALPHIHKSPAQYNALPGLAPRPARPTTPWDAARGVSAQTSSISARSASSPLTRLSGIQSALERGTAPSSPHHG